MLSGIYRPDSGRISVNGHWVSIRSPKEAIAMGIGMIHQHFKLVDVLTARENIVLGLKGRLREDPQALCQRFGLEVDLDKKIYNMSVGEKQTVEIIKVLARGADILILDEPTAVLTPQEKDKLFAILRRMRQEGHAVVIITHKLAEVLVFSDRVTILRKGESVGTVVTSQTTVQQLTEFMVGRPVSLKIDREEQDPGATLLDVHDLCVTGEDGSGGWIMYPSSCTRERYWACAAWPEAVKRSCARRLRACNGWTPAASSWKASAWTA
jgi:simple sugar transport system ATP-binding protein